MYFCPTVGSIKESPVAPHHHPHVANLSTPLDISSPLRMLTIASPGNVTPLGALMQSPQLQQKVGQFSIVLHLHKCVFRM